MKERLGSTEVAYNALHGRLGIGMPATGTYTEAKRPRPTDTYFIAWETLAHAGNPG
ncbi:MULTISPECIES: hypothetical protein [Streptomyces]|uniref:hypothetical protein n=1 Tax=Streptomyces TaxID=1883 RepID=UPI0013DBEC5C|nr:hypothetical protein [Streptomyces aureoverticillatus]QIB48174.1 hypothetical protein G3H79_38965 [Streptomyces aureoverticillatus]